MAKFESDASGFLVGSPLGNAQAVKLLAGIKGDTKRILEAMGRVATAKRGGSGARAPMGASYSAAIAPGGRAVATARALARDATTGRFISAPRSAQPTPTEQRMMRSAEVSARAAAVVAGITEAQRREDKSKAATQARGKDGRFGSGGGKGGRGGGSGGGDGVGSSLAQAGGAALAGTEQIDPLLGAANEVKGLASTIKGVASPLLGGARGLFGRFRKGGADKEQAEQTGWLKKIWKALRGRGGDSGGLDLGSLIPGMDGWLPKAAQAMLPLLARFLGPAALAALGAWIAKALYDQYKTVNAEFDKRNAEATKVEGSLANASRLAGGSSEFAIANLRAESGGSGNPFTAQNGSSTAYGIGQITNESWLGSLRKYGGNQKGAGGYLPYDTSKMTMEEALRLRNDKDLQMAMAASLSKEAEDTGRRFAKDQGIQFMPSYGRAAYVLGSGEGRKYLDALAADSSASSASVLSQRTIDANPMFKDKSLREIDELFSAQMAGGPAPGARFKRAGGFVGPMPLEAQSVVKLPYMPSVTAPSSALRIGEVPSLDFMAPPIGGNKQASVVRVDATPTLGQDVRDRDIAHIATGGIGQASRR